MSPYRDLAALVPLDAEASPVRGLVRRNGTQCMCTPPGHFWCWRKDVGDGDRWFCAHGGGWLRVREPRHEFFNFRWENDPAKKPDEA